MGLQTAPAKTSNDEPAIRDLVDKWLDAGKTGDLETVLGLMTDDVVCMVPGKEPFGKDEFAASNREMKDIGLEATSNIQEIKVLGDWAWMRNHLEVRFTPPNGEATVHSGYVLTILRKNSDGTWAIARDANLLIPQSGR